MGHVFRPSRVLPALLACATALSCPVVSASPPASGIAAAGAEAAPGPLRRAAYSRTVERVQQGLNDLGYDAGPEDGLYGRTTAIAIRRYQRDHDLRVTGEASQGLLRHIRDRLERTSGASDGASPEQARRDDPRSSTQQAAESGDGALIIPTQTQLRRLGHDVRLSGTLDDATAEAIRTYQRRQDLLVTGTPSRQLLQHMKDTLADRDPGERDISRPATVTRVQSALNARGYDAGPEDGVMGPSTREAIRTYQADAGLPITGTVSQALLRRLDATPGDGEGDDRRHGGAGGYPDGSGPGWTTVFADSFDGAAGLGATRWERVAGEVAVRDGALVTRVAAPAPQNVEDLGRAVLTSVLSEALGVAVPNSQQGDHAAAVRDAKIGMTFRVEATLSTAESGAANEGPRVLNLGVYSGRNVASGLRLLYSSDGGGAWRLLRSTGDGATTLASSSGPTLSDGARHDIRWERSPDGAMTVRVDGGTVMRSGSDMPGTSGGGGAFDGLSLINRGGTWILHQARVSDQRE
ncbi:peptidoglycan-binding protein [uncultured Rhodospira sp.]|uniref:peptidoglycan-binding domain-containing protein n=1 Tax=uncultured Rhodospira sp. TaxID=1936189 RepID=UPI00262E317E|nr:peptidoglycan-binding protein [uncultured Rhodospira sp.]